MADTHHLVLRKGVWYFRRRVPKSLVPRFWIFGNLPLQVAIERAAAGRHPTMSPITQQGYLRALTDMLELAVRKRLIPSNPAKGLSPLRRDTVAPHDKRLPFEPDQLSAFFHGEFYGQCAASGPEPFRADKTGWRFWLPLISLFTGARPNEICQLELSDIRLTDQGTWYFDHVLVAEDDDRPTSTVEPEMRKRLKTATSRRKIPLHPQLIRIGLLRYVESLREAGASRLFPTLKADAFTRGASPRGNRG